MPPERLELEITETALIDGAFECLGILKQFKALGVTIALDDFGTGYSSLSQLTLFPFDRIKIDKSFTLKMTSRADCAAIIAGVLALARSLEIATTAEGVETSQQYTLLKLAGVSSLQGYLIKRPGPPEELDFNLSFQPKEEARVALRRKQSRMKHPRSEDLVTTSGLIDEMEAAVGTRDLRRQSQVMRQLTDVFLANQGRTPPDQTDLFDQVMSKLVHVIDERVRAEFGSSLLALPIAPTHTLNLLALDESIEVAGPILEGAEGLHGSTLVECAGVRSQNHLLAISRRTEIPRSVTDILVARGNAEVLISTAANEGAQLSEAGAASLCARASENPSLASCLWARSDLPRQHLLTLFERASEEVADKLMEADSSKAQVFRNLVAEAADRIRDAVRAESVQHSAALAGVTALYQAGSLDEQRVGDFASSKSFDEVVVSLSILCALPMGAVERAMSGRRIDQMLVLAKAAGLSWGTTKCILTMTQSANVDAQRDVFARLQSKTAKTALQYYRLRSRAVQSA